MSSRSKPVAVVGSVHVLSPTGGGPYFRLTWTEPDGRPGGTSGGRSLEGAEFKAREIDEGLRRATGPQALTTLGEIMTEYVSTGEGRNEKTHGDWTPSYHAQTRQVLARSLRGFENRPALELDRVLADRIRAQAGTRRTVGANTSRLRSFLRWGNTRGYFSATQVEMLPYQAAEVSPAVIGTAAPRRRSSGRHVGQSEKYVRSEDAPSARQVVRVGDELQAHFPSWGKLAVELAASSGPRWGEQFQLTANDLVTPHAGPPILQIHHQIDPAARVKEGRGRRKLPKGEKIREAGVLTTTFTGYPLLKEMKMRRDHALLEQAEGTNPEALLFPAERGGMLHHSAFMDKRFHPAALAAGWPVQRWTEERERWHPDIERYVRESRPRLQFELTWHSLRHRFAREAIDDLGLDAGELMAVGGWENESVVKDRYYNSGKEHQDSALAKFR